MSVEISLEFALSVEDLQAFLVACMRAELALG
jgi:hypothetical protein